MIKEGLIAIPVCHISVLGVDKVNRVYRTLRIHLAGICHVLLVTFSLFYDATFPFFTSAVKYLLFCPFLTLPIRMNT